MHWILQSCVIYTHILDYRSSRYKSPDHDDYRRHKSPDHGGYRSSRHKSPDHGDYRSSRHKSPDRGDYRSSRYKSPDYRHKSPGHDRRATGSSRSHPHTRQLKIRCGPHYGRGAGPHVNKYVLEEKHEKMRKEEQHKVSYYRLASVNIYHLIFVITLFCSLRSFSEYRFLKSSVKIMLRSCVVRERSLKMS